MATLPNTRAKQDLPPKGGYPEVSIFSFLMTYVDKMIKAQRSSLRSFLPNTLFIHALC